MRESLSTVCLALVLLFTVSAFAVDRVVVIPLTRCADGLTKCSGQCVDTANNPSFCGNCTTDCGAGNVCSNGECRAMAGTSCTTNTECLTGFCVANVCSGGKRVFVSSKTYSANLGGLIGADTKCQALADAAGLPGTYKAWLSDDTGSPSSRFSITPGSYIRVDGATIAIGWGDLTDGSITHNINIDENGSIVETTYVFANTDPDASVRDPNRHCNRYTEGGDINLITGVGDTRWTSTSWTKNGERSCKWANRIYCFQQ